MRKIPIREKIAEAIKDGYALQVPMKEISDAILAAVREEVEGMKKNVTDDSSGYYREALSDVLEKLK